MRANPPAEELYARKWRIWAVAMVGLFMALIDITIVNITIPTLERDLDAGVDTVSWVLNAYNIVFAVVLVSMGRLADQFGRKRFFLIGLGIFTLGSLLCGIAGSIDQLIAFRALQGVGGGIVFSSVFATIGDLFSPAERGKYMGLFTGTFTLASVLGPTFGGLLTDHAGWRWVFYINIPVGAVALPAIWYNLPFTRSERRPRIDFAGALFLSTATISGLLALAWSGEEYGWTSAITLGLIGLAVAALAAFAVQELRHPEPIIPFHLFRNREFLLGNLIVLSVGLAMMGTIPYLPTFLQTALDASATASGLLTTPQSLGLLATSIIGGQILSRTGRYKRLIVLGVALICMAMGLMLTLSPGTPTWRLSAIVVVLGLGGGLTMPTMSVVIQNAVSHRYLGVATSARQFFMQIGGVLGTAVFGVLLTTTFQAQFREDVSPATRAAVAPQTLQTFEDPTLALDQRTFEQVQAEVRALPDGEAHLADAQQAQRAAITTAIHRIFLVSLVILGATLLLALLLKERPLRRSVGPVQAAEPSPEGLSPTRAASLSAH